MYHREGPTKIRFSSSFGLSIFFGVKVRFRQFAIFYVSLISNVLEVLFTHAFSGFPSKVVITC